MKTFKDHVAEINPDEYKEFVLSHSDKEVREHYHISNECMFRLLKYFNIKFTNSEKFRRRELNAFDKWGMSLAEHQQQINTKREETNLERFGYKHASQAPEIKARQESTLMKNYGVKNPGQSSIIRERVEATCEKKFGYRSNLLSPEFRQEYEQRCFDKHGYRNPFQSEQFQQELRDNVKLTYGVDNMFQLDWVKEKSKQTCLIKFGTEYASQAQSFKDSVVATCNKKYGVDNPSQVPEFKEKAKKTNLERHGYEYASQSPHFKEQSKQTSLKNWGYEFPSQSPIVKEKTKKTNNKLYGVDWYCMLPECRSAKGSNSTPNLEFEQLLINNDISYTREFSLEHFVYDFKVENILIELNPAPTHNSTWSPYGDYSGLDRYYHVSKTEIAMNNGYRCIHVWDWDNLDNIIKLLLDKPRASARNSNIKLISQSEAKSFIDNHSITSYEEADYHIGLFNSQGLISVATFKHIDFMPVSDFEFVQYCSSYNVMGGVEKLFKYFANEYHPEGVITSCDLSKFKGDLYTRLGFTQFSIIPTLKHWYNMKTKEHFTQYEVYDEQRLLNDGFVEIQDAGHIIYEWRNCCAETTTN